MEFQSKIVVANKGFGARLAWAGGAILVLAVFLALKDGYERYALWTFGLAGVMLVGGAILARGDLGERKVSATELVVNVSEIRIGELVYSLAKLQDIRFYIDGYDGMADTRYYAADAAVVDGTGNSLSFQSGGTKVKCWFFLAGQEDVRALAFLFREFYERRITFREEGKMGRTFLFEAVTEEQWNDKMIENGYR